MHPNANGNWAVDSFGNLVFLQCGLNWISMYFWDPAFCYEKGQVR